ncbi:phosphomannomutase/phosphoglucomutase [Candidatus Uhrbacteria bacterium]|nr:phosphomannomutase/phosphoglucomutase [Candidatus Uhrbacteria bacterium]
MESYRINVAQNNAMVNYLSVIHNARHMIDPKVFKAYDIRGTSPGVLDETFARRLGKVLAHLYHPEHVLVGHDMRTTSPVLEAALIEGLTVSGVSVTRVGLCSTPMFYVGMGEAEGKYQLGIMVTASHNPGPDNGFKLMRGDHLPIGQGSGMEEIREAMLSEESFFDATEPGSVEQDEGLLERYIERICGLAALPARLPVWRIAIDAGNGMDGLVLPKLCRRLPGFEFIRLFWDLDGTFPNHEANPLKVETLVKLQEQVTRNACIFGAAFDGDGDRVGFVDEMGTPIPGDILTALFAQEMLRAKGPGKVLYDIRSSWSTPLAIQSAGGEPVMSKVGHANIKKSMRESGALFAGELSMHFYFSDLWNHESGDYAFLLLLKILLREQKPLSEIWRPLVRYAHSGEINFTVQDPKSVIARLEAFFHPQCPAFTSYLDGLRMEFRDLNHPENDWWFNVRPSNTEPVLRLTLEAADQDKMNEHKRQLSQLIQS